MFWPASDSGDGSIEELDGGLVLVKGWKGNKANGRIEHDKNEK